MNTKREIQHVRQSDKERNCGAACLAMVYQMYGKSNELQDITKNVMKISSNGKRNCRNFLMLRDATEMGFLSYVVSAKDIREFIPFCLELGMEIIINYHPTERTMAGHFSLVSYVDSKFVYVNDPGQDAPIGINFPIYWGKLEKRMLSGTSLSEFYANNTMLVLLPPGLSLPISNKRPIPECLFNMVHKVLTFNDEWIPIF